MWLITILALNFPVTYVATSVFLFFGHYISTIIFFLLTKGIIKESYTSEIYEHRIIDFKQLYFLLLFLIQRHYQRILQKYIQNDWFWTLFFKPTCSIILMFIFSQFTYLPQNLSTFIAYFLWLMPIAALVYYISKLKEVVHRLSVACI